MKTRSRKSILPSVALQVLTESGYMCSNPRCRHILTIELHHLVWVKDGGSNDASNLLALCANCHGLHTKGHIPREAIQAWKQMVQLVSGSLDRDSLDLLLFLYGLEKESEELEGRRGEWQQQRDEERALLERKDSTTLKEIREHEQKWAQAEPRRGEMPLRVSGDGLLRMVRLIRTGLVDQGRQQLDVVEMTYFFYWEPRLTDTGRRLAKAFVEGDSAAFVEILTGTA
jgi:hypothetical protein